MRARAASLARVLFVAGIAPILTSCTRTRLVDDLTARLENARRQPTDGAFDIVTAATDRGTMRCVETHGATRLTYHVTVPNGATLSVWTATATSAPTDTGVAYLVGVADDHTYRTVATETSEPATTTRTTRWRHSRFRLDEYQGMTINVVFNTRARESSTAPPGVGLWCSPAILVH